MLLAILLIVSFCSFGQQRQSAVWHFGYHYKLDFNKPIPEVTYYQQGPLSIYNFGMWASICDKNGNYQFSAHFNKIFDRDQKLMKGGERLHGAPMLLQPGSLNSEFWTPLIVERPNSIYWVFWYQPNTCVHGSTNELACPGNPNGSINRAIIDMKKQNGFGEVIVQKDLIDTFSARHIAVMVHQNNRDSWLVTHGAMNDEFRAYLINDTGLVRTPVRTTAKPNYGGFSNNLQGQNSIPQHGMMISAPNSELLCACPNGTFMTDDTSCYLYKFNRSNGTLEYKQRLKLPSAVTAHTFSVDSKKIYFLEGNGDPWPNPTGIGMRVWQFDLSLPDTTSTQLSRNSSGRFYSRFGTTGMLAMDGKIYPLCG